MSSMNDRIEVRQRIASDHAVLRSLIRALIAVTRTRERDQRQRSVIRDVLGQLRDEVDRHFEYEERVLVPLMRGMGPCGPARAEQFCRDHAEQRAVIVALIEDAQDGGRDVEDLACEIVWFFERFEQDMAEEEQRLLSAEAIGAEPIIDQIDG